MRSFRIKTASIIIMLNFTRQTVKLHTTVIVVDVKDVWAHQLDSLRLPEHAMLRCQRWLARALIISTLRLMLIV